MTRVCLPHLKLLLYLCGFSSSQCGKEYRPEVYIQIMLLSRKVALSKSLVDGLMFSHGEMVCSVQSSFLHTWTAGLGEMIIFRL